jgi:uracil-DNA glycosylase family protein
MPRKGSRSAADYLPETFSLKSLREAAAHCRGCELYKNATQTVFGEGKSRAKIMFVGEQPGDSEDKQGHPFVGPAGMLLRKAMQQAGIDPRSVYITNAVKHFKFIERGKRRIHQKPKVIEIQACMPWLAAEIEVVRPDVVVTLGATASQAMLGSGFRLTKHRGEILSSELAPRVIATVHPSSILRSPDDETRHREMAMFVEDLKYIAEIL